MDQPPALQVSCPFCSAPIEVTDIFCPTCGKKVNTPPLATDGKTQLKIYAVSILFPPLFIGWTIKYLKAKDKNSKKIGFISLMLTVVCMMISVWFSFFLSSTLTREVTARLEQYQTIGF